MIGYTSSYLLLPPLTSALTFYTSSSLPQLFLTSALTSLPQLFLPPLTSSYLSSYLSCLEIHDLYLFLPPLTSAQLSSGTYNILQLRS